MTRLTLMNVRGVVWLGVRTDRYAEMKQFCRDVLGLAAKHDDGRFAIFDTVEGDRVELFGPGAPTGPGQFETNRVVAGSWWMTLPLRRAISWPPVSNSLVVAAMRRGPHGNTFARPTATCTSSRKFASDVIQNTLSRRRWGISRAPFQRPCT